MIRLIHNQTVVGAILVDDIDDGLPNKEVHRLGSLGDPKAYERDGYANKPKQGCYLQYSHTAPNGSIVAGHVTLQQTNKVTESLFKGKIAKMSSTPPAGKANPSAGFPLITVITGLTQASFAEPIISAAAHGPPTTITAPTPSPTTPVVPPNTFLSITPDISSVTFAKGSGATLPVTRYGGQTLTQAQIVADGGSFAAGAISINAASFTGGPSVAPVAGNTVYVTSNEQNSNTFTLT